MTQRAAYDRALQLVEHYKATGSVGSLPRRMGVATGDDSGTGTGAQRANNAREQYRYNRGWVFTAIRPIAQRVAQQPIRVGRRHEHPVTAGRGVKFKSPSKDSLPERLKSDADTLELIDTHPFLNAVAQPNEVMQSWHLIFSTVASMELTGQAFWWMPQVNGRLQIWPIPAHWMEPVHASNQFYAQWKITPDYGYGKAFTVPAHEVVYFFHPNPADPLGYYSPLQAQAYSVFADEAMQESQARTFKNGIFPGYAIIAGDVTNADDETDTRPLFGDWQRQQIDATMRRFYQGASRAGSWMLLDALIRDIKPITNKPMEMDWKDSGEQMSTRICTGFGTNPVVVGKIESANRATSTTAGEHFADWTVNPLVELVSQTLTAKVGPRFDPAGELVIWIEPVRIKDVDATRADYALGFLNGAVLINEYRVNVLGLPPIAGGDACWVPQKMQQVEMSIERLSDSATDEEEDEEDIEDAEIVTGEESPDEANE